MSTFMPFSEKSKMSVILFLTKKGIGNMITYPFWECLFLIGITRY